MPITTYNTERHKKSPNWGEHGVYISPGNNKMGHIPSFSTMPIKTCARDVPCAKDCYAVKLARVFKTTRNTWEANTEAVQEGRYDEIESDILAYLDRTGAEQFRWNVSGDIHDPGFMNMMVRVAKARRSVTFMAFTKKYALVPRHASELPGNLRIVLSSWKDFRPADALKAEYPVAYFDDGTDDCGIPTDAFHCGGNCEKCLKCFKMGPGASVYFTKH